MKKDDFREKVISFLRNLPKSKTEQYNEAFSLYRDSEGKDFNMERSYNQGYTEQNLKNILYDLQKLNAISDKDIYIKKEVPVLELLQDENTLSNSDQGTQDDPEVILKPVKDAGSSEGINNTEGQDNPEDNSDEAPEQEKELVQSEPDLEKEANQDNLEETPEQEKEVESSEDTSEKEVIQDNSAEVSDQDKEKFVSAPVSEERKRIRDDFPFLKDDDCPLELKALVTDKINAFENYCEAHNKLVRHKNGEQVLSEEELTEVTKAAVEQFEANRAIFEELNYYKANGKVLGNHPVFKSLTLQREVNSMNAEECFKYINSSKKFVSVKKAAIERLKEAKEKGYKQKVADLEMAILERNQKVTLVKKKMNISE